MNNLLTNKEDIINWLEKYQINNYLIQDNLTVDVYGDVNLTFKDLTSLPIQFGKISQTFDISNNLLNSLKGCPYEVRGYFDCSRNNLQDLNYCPTYIKGMIFCSHNQLTSLKGICSDIEVGLSCENNKLTSLEYCPKTVYGVLRCNTNKIVLNHEVFEVKGLFDISHNNLSSLDGMPQYVGSLNCSYNSLKSLEGCPNEIPEAFDCSYNKLTSLEQGPQITTFYRAIANRLQNVQYAPQEVKNRLTLDNNLDLENLDSVFSVLEIKGSTPSDMLKFYNKIGNLEKFEYEDFKKMQINYKLEKSLSHNSQTKKIKI